MAKSSKRKKHNPRKRVAEINKYLVKDTAALFVGGSGSKCETVSLKYNRVVPTLLQTARIYSSESFNWHCLLMVLCRDQFNKEYVKCYYCEPEHICTQSGMAKDLNRKHMTLINSCNKQHILNVGWIIAPFEHEWEESQVMQILNNHNAWDSLAEWELNKPK